VLGGAGIVPGAGGVVDSGAFNVPTSAPGAVGGQTAAGSNSILPPGALRAGMISGLGASIGQAMAPPPGGSSSAAMPPGFNTPMTPTSQLPKRPAPNFTGYNPYASVTSPTGPYRFY
jgi:hypothetical protein